MFEEFTGRGFCEKAGVNVFLVVEELVGLTIGTP